MDCPCRDARCSIRATLAQSAQSHKIGPFRRLEHRCGDWTIVAEELPFFTGTQWSVWAEHKDGVREDYRMGVSMTVGRVPPGPNLHDDPIAEMDRLDRLIDWPGCKHGLAMSEMAAADADKEAA